MQIICKRRVREDLILTQIANEKEVQESIRENALLYFYSYQSVFIHISLWGAGHCVEWKRIYGSAVFSGW